MQIPNRHQHATRVPYVFTTLTIHTKSGKKSFRIVLHPGLEKKCTQRLWDFASAKRSSKNTLTALLPCGAKQSKLRSGASDFQKNQNSWIFLSSKDTVVIIKIDNFRDELTEISARWKAMVLSYINQEIGGRLTNRSCWAW